MIKQIFKESHKTRLKMYMRAPHNIFNVLNNMQIVIFSRERVDLSEGDSFFVNEILTGQYKMEFLRKKTHLISFIQLSRSSFDDAQIL